MSRRIHQHHFKICEFQSVKELKRSCTCKQLVLFPYFFPNFIKCAGNNVLAVNLRKNLETFAGIQNYRLLQDHRNLMPVKSWQPYYGDMTNS